MLQEKVFWNWRSLDDEQSTEVKVGPLLLRIERHQDELYAAVDRPPVFNDDATDTNVAELPPPVWRRWVCGEGSVAFRVKPLLPPRPVIVRPVMPFQIVPGAKVDLFVSVPVWVNVCLRKGDSEEDIALFEEPTVVLSNSWFGLPVSGELCYALKTRARRRLDDLRKDAYLAICPLTLKNDSKNPFMLERLCVNLKAVSMFVGDEHLWTQQGNMVCRDDDKGGKLVFETEPPCWEPSMEKVSEPRDVARKGMAQQALDGLRNVSFRQGWL